MPPRGGLYLLDVVPDGEVRFGFPNISDNAEIVELIACGCHLTLFTTGRGSVVGSAISPVIKICANPDTYRRMADDMDVDAGRILEGRATLDEVGREIFDRVLAVAAGRADRLRAPGPPGVHPHLQDLRADRPGVFAGEVKGKGGRAEGEREGRRGKAEGGREEPGSYALRGNPRVRRSAFHAPYGTLECGDLSPLFIRRNSR